MSKNEIGIPVRNNTNFTQINPACRLQNRLCNSKSSSVKSRDDKPDKTADLTEY